MDTTPTKSSLPSSSRQRAFRGLLTAVVSITLINMARFVRVQDYLQRDPATVDMPFENKAVLSCVPMEKSHIAPGYYNPDTCFSRDQILTIIKELVFTMIHTFEAHHLTYFLDSGTLLGAFRNQSIIRHDVDADLGIDVAALAYLQTHHMEIPSHYAFSVWNSSLYPTSDRDEALPARLIHKDSGLYLDIFAYLDWTDPTSGAAMVGPVASWCFFNCARCPQVEQGKELRVPREWIYPLVNCTFEGRTTVKCPHQTQELLRYMFGESYMTPIAYTYR